jgi:hypothetical protein
MFWTVITETQSVEASAEESAEAVVQEKTENTADTPTEEKPTEVKKTGTYKMRNQKGTQKGLARWFCYDCAEPFNAPASEKHAVCPNKHSNKSRSYQHTSDTGQAPLDGSLTRYRDFETTMPSISRGDVR